MFAYRVFGMTCTVLLTKEGRQFLMKTSTSADRYSHLKCSRTRLSVVASPLWPFEPLCEIIISFGWCSCALGVIHVAPLLLVGALLLTDLPSVLPMRNKQPLMLVDELSHHMSLPWRVAVLALRISHCSNFLECKRTRYFFPVPVQYWIETSTGIWHIWVPLTNRDVLWKT